MDYYQALYLESLARESAQALHVLLALNKSLYFTFCKQWKPKGPFVFRNKMPAIAGNDSDQLL